MKLLQTISFIEISIDAGKLLGGLGKHKACFVLVISTNFLNFSEIPKSVPKFLPKFDPNILREIFSAPSDLRGAMLSRAIQNVPTQLCEHATQGEGPNQPQDLMAGKVILSRLLCLCLSRASICRLPYHAR